MWLTQRETVELWMKGREHSLMSLRCFKNDEKFHAMMYSGRSALNWKCLGSSRRFRHSFSPLRLDPPFHTLKHFEKGFFRFAGDAPCELAPRLMDKRKISSCGAIAASSCYIFDLAYIFDHSSIAAICNSRNPQTITTSPMCTRKLNWNVQFARFHGDSFDF